MAGLGHVGLQDPLYVELKTKTDPVSMHQYLISQDAGEGIKPHIDRMLQLGVLCKC